MSAQGKPWVQSKTSQGIKTSHHQAVSNLPDAHCWFWGRLGSGDREQTAKQGDDFTVTVPLQWNTLANFRDLCKCSQLPFLCLLGPIPGPAHHSAVPKPITSLYGNSMVGLAGNLLNAASTV